MGNFRSDSRGGGFRGNRSSGGYSGGFGGGRSGGRGGFNGGRSDGPREMHSVTCDKCGKQCEVPFKPTGGKPVFCSDCFKKEDGGSRGSRDSQSAGISPEQFNQLNKKLDKILEILESIEFEDEEELVEEESKE
jgi:CxxC-x17-CxxC domain-containing protein